MNESERKQLEQRIRAKAMSKARAAIGFRYHLTVFVLVNILLFAINMTTTPALMWFVWPLCGWGFAVVIHAFVTFNRPQIDEDAIEAEVARELARRGVTS